MGLWCYVDNTYEQAKRALQPIFEEHVKFAAPLGMLRYRQEQLAEMGAGDLVVVRVQRRPGRPVAQREDVGHRATLPPAAGP